MARRGQHIFRPAPLDDASEVHHRDVMREVLDHREVVGDEQVGNAELALQLLEQVEDLRLHRHVECGGRLVTDQQFGLHGKRPRDCDALALAAGKLVRITVDRIRRQADLGKQREHRLAGVAVAMVDAERRDALGDDLADAQARVERSERVLEHHLHVPAHGAQPLPLETDQFAATEADAARRRHDQLEQRLADGRLAAARFADQRQRTAGRDVQRHAVDRAHVADRSLQDATADREMYLEVGNLEKGLARLEVELGDGMAAPGRNRIAPPVAAQRMARRHVPPGRRAIATEIRSVRAAFGEAAAIRHRSQRRHLAGDGGQAQAAPRDLGQRGEQRLRVGVARPREEVLATRHLDQFAGIHDADAMRHPGDDAEVVGDQQHGHAALALELREQVENLRLDGDVKGGGRLVGNQQVGLAGQRDGDHHALLHAAGKLERILAQPPLGVGDANLAQQVEHAPAGRLAAQTAVAVEDFADLHADLQHGVEAGRRLLEDHRDARAAHLAHVGFGQGQQFLAFQPDAAAGDAPGRRQQAHDALCGGRLAATGFAEQRKGLALGNGEGNAVDRKQYPLSGHETEAQVGDFQHQAALGSKASRTASANRLAASTRMNMVVKAAASDHQTTGSRPSSMRALLIIVPKLVIVGSTPMPT